MKITKHKLKVMGHECVLDLMDFSNVDRKKWRVIFGFWKKLKLGLRFFKSREPNFPEGLSEIAFCLWSGSKRFVSMNGKSSASFDTFNLQTGRAEQIKACSIEYDLTSFGPKSSWDDLYFLDFYNNGKVDGYFDVYKIPNNLIYSVNLNKNQKFFQQQDEKRRPRFSIKKEIILKTKLKPLATNVKV